MVLHALQEGTTSKEHRSKTPTIPLKGYAVNNFENSFIIILEVLGYFDKRINYLHSPEVHKDTTGGVFGLGAHMDADAVAVGYIHDLGEGFLKLGGPGNIEFVFSFGYEEIGILDRVREVGGIVIRYRHRAQNGFTLRFLSCQDYFFH